jgi:hypothetical protein
MLDLSSSVLGFWQSRLQRVRENDMIDGWFARLPILSPATP